MLIFSTDDPTSGYGSASALRLLVDVMTGSPSWRLDAVVPRTGAARRLPTGWARVLQSALFVLRVAGSRPGLTVKPYSIVVSWQPLPTALAGLVVARRLGIPHVVRTCGPELHSRWSPFPALSIAARPLTALLLSVADVVVVKSDIERRLLPRGVRTERVHIIPNAAPSGPRRTTGPPEGQAGQRVRLLTVAQLETHKGVDRALRAVSRTAAAGVHPPLSLTVAGDGTGRLRLRRLGERLGTPVTFVGRIPAAEMPHLYAEHDALLVASELEGCSNACVEALSAGLPIIGPATALEGLVRDGESGLLSPTPAHEDLADCLRRFLVSRERWSAMGVAAIDTASRHRPEALAASYDRLFTELVRAGER